MNTFLFVGSALVMDFGWNEPKDMVGSDKKVTAAIHALRLLLGKLVELYESGNLRSPAGNADEPVLYCIRTPDPYASERNAAVRAARG